MCAPLLKNLGAVMSGDGDNAREPSVIWKCVHMALSEIEIDPRYS